MRKKFALAFATVFAVAAVATTVASASGPTVVAEGFACGVYDGNGQVFVTTNSTLTVYDSGKVVLKCNGDGAPAANSRTSRSRTPGSLWDAAVRLDDRLGHKVGRNWATRSSPARRS